MPRERKVFSYLESSGPAQLKFEKSVRVQLRNDFTILSNNVVRILVCFKFTIQSVNVNFTIDFLAFSKVRKAEPIVFQI